MCYLCSARGFTPLLGSSRRFGVREGGTKWDWHNCCFTSHAWKLSQGVPKPLGSHPGFSNLGSSRVRTGFALPALSGAQHHGPSVCLWPQTFIPGKLLKISWHFLQRSSRNFHSIHSSHHCLTIRPFMYGSASHENKSENMSLNSLLRNAFQTATSDTKSCRCKDWNSRHHTTTREGFLCLSDNAVSKQNS